MRLKVVISCFVTLLIVIAVSNYNNLDRIYIYNLTLKSNKESYIIGETIILTVGIKAKPNHWIPSKLRLYKEKSKSFVLMIRSKANGDVDFSDIDFVREWKSANSQDEIEVIKLTPDKPFYMEIQGKAQKDKSNQIIFNFGKYGVFLKPKIGEFLIKGNWRPIAYNLGDSRENYASGITISIKDKKSQGYHQSDR